jgi:hypothetical protein
MLPSLKFDIMKKGVFFIAFLIGFFGLAQETTVSVETDTTTIKIGEQIHYKITVKESNNVVFPKLQLDSLGKIEVVESLPVDTLKNKLEKKYLLTSFDSGQYVVPKQLVLINNKKFFTDSLLVNVATVKVDTLKQNLYPIKSIKKEPKTFDDYKYLLWWLIPILLLIAVIIYVIFRKKKKKEVSKVYVAPIQEALQRLKELDEKQLVKQNKIKIYYSELTDIVRTYIEKDIHIPALESTTNELIETINDFNESSNLGISNETIQQLKQVLQNADLVKFAKSKPIIDEIKYDRTTVEDILNNTQVAVQKKNLEEQNEVVTNTVIVEEQPNIKKSIVSKYLFIFIAVFVIIIAVTGYVGYQYINNTNIEATTSEMKAREWNTASYGKPSISIETPVVLNAQTVSIPDDLKEVVESVTSYNYGSLVSDFYIEVTITNFVNALENFDFDAGVQLALQQIAQKTGTNFTNLYQEIRINNGIEGRIVTANYEVENPVTQEKSSNTLTLLFFEDANNIRQVIITQLVEDKKAKEVNERIVSSISLNP